MKIILFSCVLNLLVFQINGHVLAQSSNARIVGGEPTTIENHPYQASIEVYGNHLNCGGTILSPNIIITAAQCSIYMDLRFLQVRAGTSERETGGVVRKVQKYYVHELYGLEMGADYDVSLIVLKEPLPLSSQIQPIALPEASEYLNETEMTTVTGWGELEQGSYEKPTILHKVSIPVVNQQICKHNYYNGVTDRMICAGILKEGGKGACLSDIGGPLVAHNKLHGIASWGDGCAKPWYPGVYTRVTAIRDWIREKVNL